MLVATISRKRALPARTDRDARTWAYNGDSLCSSLSLSRRLHRFDVMNTSSFATRFATRRFDQNMPCRFTEVVTQDFDKYVRNPRSLFDPATNGLAMCLTFKQTGALSDQIAKEGWEVRRRGLARGAKRRSAPNTMVSARS